MRCISRECEQEFEDAEEFRRHCIAHIEASIEAARERRPIHLPAETWTEVLIRCGPKALAEICLTRRLFHAISRPILERTTERILPELTFLEEKDGKHVASIRHWKNGKGESRLVKLPIAELAPPSNMMGGFRSIELRYFDTKVLSFLCAVRNLLDDDIFLGLSASQDVHSPFYTYGSDKIGDVAAARNNAATLECLLRVFPRLGRAITSLRIYSGYNSIGADLLALVLVNVRHLLIENSSKLPKSVIRIGTYDCSPHIRVLAKWLHSPVGDGAQKMANLDIDSIADLAGLVAQAQQHFVSTDSAPVSYFVKISSRLFRGPDREYRNEQRRVELPFDTLHNEHTSEVLTLRYYDELLENHYVLRNVLMLFRRRGATVLEKVGQTELFGLQQKFLDASRNKGSRNTLMLNVARMGEINESASTFPANSEEAGPDRQQQQDNSLGSDGLGPSCAKRIKLDNGE